MENNRKPFLERLSARLDLPGNLLAGLSRMEVIGSGTMLLEQHKGILAYTTEEIHVSVSNGVIKIHGFGLSLRSMDAQALLINGHISNIEFIS